MWQLFVLTLVATASAQIPSLGWCPEYQPMANFNMNRFLGTWYEAERYFTVREIGSRCVTTNYISTPEGRILVSNEITNYLTGGKRLIEGHLQKIGPEGEGRIMVKYTASLPLRVNDIEYNVLDTDYDSYAVLWSCSALGPVHTQNAWIMTRDRLAPMMVMQNAYATLDRYKISRTFFVKTDQADCTVLPEPAADPTGKIKVEVDTDAKEVSEAKTIDQPIEASEPELVKEKEAEPQLKTEEAKPMSVPEMIMSETEKKEEMVEKPEKPEVMAKAAEKPEIVAEPVEKEKEIPPQ